MTINLKRLSKSISVVEYLILIFLLAVLAMLAINSMGVGQTNYKPGDQSIVKRFNQIYYDSNVWKRTRFLGIPAQQNPCDLWIIQEIITELKPDFIVETGTYKGGSTLFFAAILEKINDRGKVISIDVNPQIDAASQFDTFKNRVEIIKGNSVSSKVIQMIAQRVKNDSVLVTLDSLHTKEHVLREMNLYSKFVSLGSYMIVQDTNINGHPVYPKFGPGPMEAVEEFLGHNKDFEIDHSKEKFLLTSYPSGYLKRIR